LKIGQIQDGLEGTQSLTALYKSRYIGSRIIFNRPARKDRFYHFWSHHKMQMRARKFISCAYILEFTVCNDGQSLVAINIITFFYLEIIQMPIFRDPTVTMINFHVTTGYFKNNTRRRSRYPKIGCIHSNKYIRIGSKVHRAAHFIIMRAVGQPLGAIVKPIHGNPGFSLLPGQLEHIRWRGRCEQCTGIDWHERGQQSQQNNNLGMIFIFHGYIYSFIEHKRKVNEHILRSKSKNDIFPQAHHIARF
jgi:hypothetical protein